VTGRRPLCLAVLAAASGLLAGLSSWIFLESLDRVTRWRLDHDWIVWLLPVAGAVVGVVLHRWGGRAAQGTPLVVAESRDLTDGVPARMAPLVLGGTLLTHLVGGSAGREGTALQLSGSLTDTMARRVRSGDELRRPLLVASLGGGFGAVFGVPAAGVVFALELQRWRDRRPSTLVATAIAAAVGHAVVVGLGYEHAHHDAPAVTLGVALLARLVVAGAVFGVAGAAFAWGVHLARRGAERVARPPLRPVLGGVAVLSLAAVFGHSYLGLSLPLADRALAGEELSLGVATLKLVFTVVTLGAGFPGGEVTPLFVIGSTLGAAIAAPLGLPVALAAAVGFVAVFGAAAKTPAACTIMAAELFGVGLLVPAAVACAVARLCAGRRGIYPPRRPAPIAHGGLRGAHGT
jgi:H+/Cl- antiporter ClcA